MQRFYRRHLPHWRIESPGIVYFVTWRLARGQHGLPPDERDTVAAAIEFWNGTRCLLTAWVVMDDHVHVVLSVLGDGRLERLQQSWKSYTANQLAGCGRRAPVWQDESFDRVVRDAVELRQTVLYVCSNPLKRWPELEEYRWVWPELRNLE